MGIIGNRPVIPVPGTVIKVEQGLLHRFVRTNFIYAHDGSKGINGWSGRRASGRSCVCSARILDEPDNLLICKVGVRAGTSVDGAVDGAQISNQSRYVGRRHRGAAHGLVGSGIGKPTNGSGKWVPYCRADNIHTRGTHAIRHRRAGIGGIVRGGYHSTIAEISTINKVTVPALLQRLHNKDICRTIISRPAEGTVIFGIEIFSVPTVAVTCSLTGRVGITVVHKITIPKEGRNMRSIISRRANIDQAGTCRRRRRIVGAIRPVQHTQGGPALVFHQGPFRGNVLRCRQRHLKTDTATRIPRGNRQHGPPPGRVIFYGFLATVPVAIRPFAGRGRFVTIRIIIFAGIHFSITVFVNPVTGIYLAVPVSIQRFPRLGNTVHVRIVPFSGIQKAVTIKIIPFPGVRYAVPILVIPFRSVDMAVAVSIIPGASLMIEPVIA
ncbi:MAG: hypothetical protein BWY09_02013 [Candidatus Hydrogenedentes bacterium ADurb.Bin179]|nr:MAG: hypothetical protein BWY09_02013 [Candidatus Hydrogenedentes bacterium ADurb.Bin179]